ncbi:hypothetical protein BIW11_04066, partial [Tropilaelaps mercedesae]
MALQARPLSLHEPKYLTSRPSAANCRLSKRVVDRVCPYRADGNKTGPDEINEQNTNELGLEPTGPGDVGVSVEDGVADGWNGIPANGGVGPPHSIGRA